MDAVSPYDLPQAFLDLGGIREPFDRPWIPFDVEEHKRRHGAVPLKCLHKWKNGRMTFTQVTLKGYITHTMATMTRESEPRVLVMGQCARCWTVYYTLPGGVL